MAGGSLKNSVEIEIVAFTTQQDASGRMAQNGNVVAGDSAQQTLGHLLRLLLEVRVHAGDDQVHFVQYGAGEIQFAVGENIDFNPSQHLDVPGLSRRLANSL